MLLGQSSLIEYVQTFNGREPVQISVYAFGRFRNRKPVVQSAFIDCLYLRGDPEEYIAYVKQLNERNILHRSRYDGEYIDSIIPLSRIYDNIHDTVDSMKETINLPYSRKTWDLHLWYRTWNPKTNRYVIDVCTDDLDKLDKLSTNPIKGSKISGKYIDRTQS